VFLGTKWLLRLVFRFAGIGNDWLCKKNWRGKIVIFMGLQSVYLNHAGEPGSRITFAGN
jgi:hypothetical protein